MCEQYFLIIAQRFQFVHQQIQQKNKQGQGSQPIQPPKQNSGIFQAQSVDFGSDMLPPLPKAKRQKSQVEMDP